MRVPKGIAIPDAIGVIEGFRAWKAIWTAGEVWIESLANPVRWAPARSPGDASITAECGCPLSPGHLAPDLDGTCGVYAWRDEFFLWNDLGYDPVTLTADGGVVAVVVGAVKLWGGVIMAERGFRAQKARIGSLEVPGGHWCRITPISSEGFAHSLRTSYLVGVQVVQ